MRELREGAGLRQDDVAATAREYGLRWGRSSVAQLESGTRDLSINEFVVLPAVFTTATGKRVTVETFLDGIRVRRTRRVDVDEPDDAERKAARVLDVHAQQLAHESRVLWGRGLSAERDRRVQKRSDDDATPRRLQALRGHVTRELLDELRAHIDRRK